VPVAFEAKPLLYALHDSLMLLAPPGWTQVELSVVATPGGLRVGELKAQGDQAKAPRARPQLHVDLSEEAHRFGEAIGELAAGLASVGKAWAPGAVRVERPPGGFADWKLLRADGSVAWFNRLERAELDSLLITDALLDTLAGTERAFHDLQGQLQQRLGRVTDFAFDPAHGMLRLTRPAGEVELAAQVVGSYLPDLFTWVWSWAEEGARDASMGRVRRVCQPELKADGQAAFWRPHFHCDEGFAWALAGNVVVSIGARGLFRAQPPGADGALFFAVMELPALTPPA
jgi:hypothetical protein